MPTVFLPPPHISDHDPFPGGRRALTALTLATGLAVLAACGGGGGGSGPAPVTGTTPIAEPATETIPAVTQITSRLESRSVAVDNHSPVRHATPRLDLPSAGNGLRVTEPSGVMVPVRVVMVPALKDALEPNWRGDAAARARLDSIERMTRRLAAQALLQWSRHLTYDHSQSYNPGPVTVQLGGTPERNCGRSGACSWGVAGGDPSVVVIMDHQMKFLHTYGPGLRWDPEHGSWSIRSLFAILTHEFGHQFDYHHDDGGGSREGCGNRHCHAARGSNSVMGAIGNGSRFNVIQDDIAHLGDFYKAVWNGRETDRYTLSRSGVSESIAGWGVWIDHRYSVQGRTWSRSDIKENLDIIDRISGTGWVNGTPSRNVTLQGTASWSGEESFLGVDLRLDSLGLALRADTELTYRFGSRPMMDVHIDGLETHTAAAGWHDATSGTWGDFSYRLDCNGLGCTDRRAVTTQWYADDGGDPAGHVGGVVRDQVNAYAGAFVADRD